MVEPTELDLLRAVYVTRLRDGRASVASICRELVAPVELVRSSVQDALKKRLLLVRKSKIELTPAGRARLKVVMIGGAFEIIHPGHIHTISEARMLGNTLVVIVATDESVARNKGREPVTGQALRVGLVSSLRQVDLALPGNEGSIFEILLKVRPDIVAIGYDQHHDPAQIVREAGKRGIRLRATRLHTPLPEVKTSKILNSL